MTSDLHGNAPDDCPVALLLVDVINQFDFPEADQLLTAAVPMAERLAALKRQARRAKVPVIYANDNFGRWRSDFHAVVAECRKPGTKGRPVVEPLLPADEDYFILKPKHTAFYMTALDLLLKHLGTRTLVLGGLAGNICVLFTANDAYMRDYRIVVPTDGIASNTAAENDAALDQMRTILKCDVRPAAEIDFDELKRSGRKEI